MLNTHGDEKYRSDTLVTEAAEWDRLRVEVRQIGSGRQNCVVPACTELVHILSGRARVRRRGNGELQEAMALPGTSWLVPAGTEEDLLELDGSTECLIVFLPPKLLTDSALQDFDIRPEKAQLAYAGGFSDDVLTHLGAALHSLVTSPTAPLDRLFVDGVKTALAARLVSSYRAESWQPSHRPKSLQPRRLQRVLDLIEARMEQPLRLGDLAGEACLSPFHFSRLFAETTGRTPHAYLTERRVAAAEGLLRQGTLSLAQIALEVGLGSQANFSRIFRKLTGVSPGQYRSAHVSFHPPGRFAEAPFAK